MKVIAACQINGPAECSDKLLKSYLQAYMPAPRRIDPFILQCLLAGALLKEHISPDCGLYLAADYPCAQTMSRLLSNVVLEDKLPKPLEFVNSVSNAAGFYLAQSLGLEGPNLFIGAGPTPWQQLCQLAAVDLAEGVISQALLIHCHNVQAFEVRGLLLSAEAGSLDSSSFASLCATVALAQLQIQNPNPSVA